MPREAAFASSIVTPRCASAEKAAQDSHFRFVTKFGTRVLLGQRLSAEIDTLHVSLHLFQYLHFVMILLASKQIS